MKKWLIVTVVLVVISCAFSLSFAQTGKTVKATYTYTGGIEGRVKNVINPPLLTGVAKLLWDPKKSQGNFSLNMVGAVAECTVTSSDKKSFTGNFSCNFGGDNASGPVQGTFGQVDSSGIPQTMQGSFDMTVPEQGGAEYIGTFNGHFRDW